MKKTIPIIKKYLPDGLILLGVVIFSYNLLRPATRECFGKCNPFNPINGNMNYHNNLKVFGILILTLGIIIAIRRYLSSKNH